MRQADEWKTFILAVPALLAFGLVGVWAEGYRSDLFQLTGMLCNRFALFLVGYYWLQDKRSRVHGVRGETAMAGSLQPLGPAVSRKRWRAANAFLLWSSSIISLVVAIALIPSDFAPRGVLVLIQIVVPLHGLFDGILYRASVARRQIVHRLKFLQLVGDEETR